MVESGVNINGIDNDGHTPLDLAVGIAGLEDDTPSPTDPVLPVDSEDERKTLVRLLRKHGRRKEKKYVVEWSEE